MANIIHNEYHMNLTVDVVELAPGALANYKIAYLTGTTAVT